MEVVQCGGKTFEVLEFHLRCDVDVFGFVAEVIVLSLCGPAAYHHELHPAPRQNACYAA